MDHLKQLKKIRFFCMVKQPFFGNMLANLPMLISTADDTAWTDSTNITFNPDFLEGLPFQEAVFTMCHEILHIVYMHCDLRKIGNKNRKLWGYAADYRVNYDCYKANIGDKPTWVYYEEKYDEEWTVEDIYYDLKNQIEANGGHVPDNDEEEAEQEKVLREYLDNLPEGDDKSSSHKAWGSMSDEAKRKITKAIIRSVQAAKAQGSAILPNVARYYEDLSDSKIPWQDLVVSTLASDKAQNKSWAKFNRRYLQNEVYLPWYSEGKKAKYVVGFDTSGSIGAEEIRTFASEMYGAFESLDDFECLILCFNCDVVEESVREFVKGDPMDYIPMGNGGTHIKSITDYLDRIEYDAEHVFVFTDCYSSDWCDAENYEVTYISTSSKVAPTGSTILYNSLGD